MEALIGHLTSFRFTFPPSFFLMVTALTLLCLFLPPRGRTQRLAIDLRYWQRRIDFNNQRIRTFSALLAVTAILLGLLAVDPFFMTKQAIRVYGKPVMLVLDISGSMESQIPKHMIIGGKVTDARTNYEKARDTFYDLISRHPDVNFGLLPFSSENYIARYFANKNELFADTLENRDEITFIATGTRISEALSKAHRILEETFPHVRGSEPDKAIILISDIDVDPEPFAEMADEIERARWAGIEVYVILIEQPKVLGRPERVHPPIKVVNMVSMNDKEGIDAICQAVADLPNSPIREEEAPTNQSLIPYLVPVILGLTILCLMLSETIFRRVP